MAKSNLAYNKIVQREAEKLQELLQKSLQQDSRARSDGERKLERINGAMKIFREEKGEWGLTAAKAKTILKAIASEDVFNTMGNEEEQEEEGGRRRRRGSEREEGRWRTEQGQRGVRRAPPT